MAAEGEGVELTLRFAEALPIALLDLSAFLFDVNRLYVIAFKVEQDLYEIREDSYRGYGRGSFRVPKIFQLRVAHIRFGSPGLVILGAALAAIPAVLGVLQIVEKVELWSLRKEKLHLEVEKLRHDAAVRRISRVDVGLPFVETIEPERGRFRRLRRRRERQRIEPILNLPVTKSAVNQLSSNPLKPTDLTVDIVPEIRGFGLADDDMR